MNGRPSAPCISGGSVGRSATSRRPAQFSYGTVAAFGASRLDYAAAAAPIVLMSRATLLPTGDTALPVYSGNVKPCCRTSRVQAETRCRS
jgi:hypothetical protein